ncbi:Arsenical resistance operon trans-acting repressor ArsD [Arthrobacter sp. SO5]|uniref:arsenic metallochaperone ArsD family protein n=1 Tax=Arthrobacter sp. SO5 TaxID=1897055 RepID=UPI001E5DC06A|nr:arsenic metallochaperone ArsD family protein [Arthrobacter sp. SO5]MCB5274971.1 Arsenical resistance operon trans-acting repressor ArsD [Arthrobacter sp. SO5]
MPAIRIYESALCCDTGVCGADIARNNPSSEPTAFAEDETVRGFVYVVGSKGLPLTIDGVTVAAGTSPSRKQLLRLRRLREPRLGPA